MGNISETYYLGDFSDWINDICITSNDEHIYAAVDNGYIIDIDIKRKQITPIWKQPSKRRWDKPGIMHITIDKESDYIIAITLDYDICIINQKGCKIHVVRNLKERFVGILQICSLSQVENSSYILIGDEKGDMWLYDIMKDELIDKYHRIENAQIVGCDFRNADFGEDEGIKENIRSSGGRI